MKNTFTFYDDYTSWPSSVCLAFLNDCPSSVLKNIQHIALNIGDENCAVIIWQIIVYGPYFAPPLRQRFLAK